ncbi:ASST-domain-containing protein [Clohesyomyces aquaticus]|uniref:ASST-domain-containing protein n=1 Tax=Clohesyomyces aquaticus TaxID=1231657 RepID=A0A1Y1YYD1_9PLEO|nr:ASST-domain-containing protein [Clohesyomyces aquaticus]
MNFSLRSILAFFILVCLAVADWQYHSRPDLSPPRLNITIPATSDVEQGYIFVAPYNANQGYKQDGSDQPEQPAAYIFRNDGDLVWSSVSYLSGFVSNFQPARYQGQDILLAGEPQDLFLHEFTIVDEKTALVEIYDQIPIDLSPWSGNETQRWLVDAIVQELDIETGDVLFEWRSLDHVDPSHSVLPLGQRPFEGTSSFEAWDYFHINSIDKNEEGDYLISGRHVSAVYKLDGKTGDIVWQIGGKNSDFKFEDKELQFAFQHDARFRGREDDVEFISLFDNGAGSNGHQGGDKNKIRNFSTGKTARVVQEVVHPEKIHGASQGNTQILSNGNIFANWGQAGEITEFRGNDSTPIFNARLDSGDLGAGVQNYRGFRGGWTGRPKEPPAIVALEGEDGAVGVYVSWNGDTETTKSWRFFAKREGKQKLLGEKERKGFETVLEAKSTDFEVNQEIEIFAEALDGNGRVISRTEVAALRRDVRVEDSLQILLQGGQEVMKL